MSVYAIRFGPWVEIRESRLPPIKRDMEVVVNTEELTIVPEIINHPVYGPMVNRYRQEKVKVKRKLTDVVYEGGEFVVCIPYTRWSPRGVKNGLPSLKDGDCMEVMKAPAKLLLDEEDRNTILGKVAPPPGQPFQDQEDRDDDDHEDNGWDD